MSRESLVALLDKALHRWRRQLYLGYVLKALSAGIAIAAILHFAFAQKMSVQIFGCVVVALLFFVMLIKKDGRHRAGREEMARHLDRHLPELQESCQLVLKPASALSSVEQIQQKRVLEQLQNNRHKLLLPDTKTGQSAVFLATAIILMLLSIWLAPLVSRQTSSRAMLDVPPAGSDADAPATSAIAIESIAVTVRPPAYTRLPEHRSDSLDIRTVEGARVTWTLHFSQKLQVAKMIFSDGDTLAFAEAGERQYRASKTVRESGFYYFGLAGAKGAVWHSPYFPIDVTKDRPPEVTILAPPPRTELAFDQPWRVPVRISATDDYRITDAFLLATVSSGAGENVKFREDTLRFAQKTASAEEWQFTRMLDLQQLKMAPGDELYFHIELFDNKMPQPNRSRSDTRFVTIADTAQALYASTEGIAVNLVPDYFRSQRQIIIDTIELIEEEPSLPEREFKSRSNELGFDQKALRLRYGQFLGEESESDADFTVENEQAEESHDHAGEAEGGENALFDIFDENNQLIGSDLQSDPLLADLVHFHDSAEATTLFSASIREQLKAALAAMWDAELHLRTFRPKEALPYEYQALRLLKNIQQKSRIYVKRIGFDPPPLEPDKKRLTGELDAIEAHTVTEQELATDSLAAVRATLVFLQKLQESDGSTESAPDMQMLEQAAHHLAQRAIANPHSYLDGLQDLRTLTERLQQGEPCAPCLPSIQAALWRLLPAAHATAFKKPAVRSQLSRSYFSKISGSE